MRLDDGYSKAGDVSITNVVGPSGSEPSSQPGIDNQLSGDLVIPAGVTSLDVSVKLKAEKRFRADDHLELTVSDPKPNQVQDGNGFAVLPRAFDGTDKPSNPDGNNGGTDGNIFYGIDDHNRIWQVQPEEREDRRLYMVLDPEELYKKNGMNSNGIAYDSTRDDLFSFILLKHRD